jgi:hypothetical protein
MIRKMVSANTNGPMVENMSATGKMENRMVMESIFYLITLYNTEFGNGEKDLIG